MNEKIRKHFTSLTRGRTEIYHILSRLCWLRYEKKIITINKMVGSHALVLDLGCGLGQVSAILSQHGSTPVALDVIREQNVWKNVAKQYGCHFVRADGNFLPFKNKIFDAVACFGVIEHIRDDKLSTLFREVGRILTSAGLFFIFDLPNKNSISEKMARRLGFYYHEKVCEKTILAALEENGFMILRIAVSDLIPAQTHRINMAIGELWNICYQILDKLDCLLLKTPLKKYANYWEIVSRPRSRTF